MEEILYELRTHASGLNAGRWDYLFSTIKTLRSRRDLVLPDRAQLTMTVPFMRAYTELLVATCHRRGAHAMGGMAPFIPSRKDPEVNEAALAKVREDKQREAGDGFDGTWVAHPDLVPVAMEVFDDGARRPPEPEGAAPRGRRADAAKLVDTRDPGGTVTEAGFRNNVNVALQYLSSWLSGNGRRRDLQPDGGRRDGRDLALPALAVDPQRGAADGRAAVSRRRSTARSAARSWHRWAGRAPGHLLEAAELLDALVESRRVSRVPDASRPTRAWKKMARARGHGGLRSAVPRRRASPPGWPRWSANATASRTRQSFAPTSATA